MNFNTSSIDDSNPALCDIVARRIAESPQQQITFAEYMELVLYHPTHGYYATNAVNLGAQGDFFTSPHLGADFGELLAEQFVQMWEILQRPVPFTLLEMGAGQGILAADILGYLHRKYPDFFKVLEYVIVELSAALRKEQQQRLQNFMPLLRWCNLDEIPASSITGCCFSNELVDALPVHQFIIKERQLQEIYVTTSDGSNFEEVIGEPSTPMLAKYFDLVRETPPFGFAAFNYGGKPSCSAVSPYNDGALSDDFVKIELLSSAYPDGYRSEVNLAALDWLKMVAERLQRGYLLTIDYGYPAKRYYSPARSQGTLQCYYHHRHHDNPYINIGRQDITAHVNFTALEYWGKLCALNNVGFTQQGLFLMALGLSDRIASLSTTSNQSIQQVLQRRDSLHQLIQPMGLGGFGVLIQSKGLTATQITQSLKGLTN